MHFTLQPLNEGQSMNAVQPFVGGTREQAINKARRIARMMQSLLPSCSITCAVCRPGEDPEGGHGITVFPDGKTIP